MKDREVPPDDKGSVNRGEITRRHIGCLFYFCASENDMGKLEQQISDRLAKRETDQSIRSLSTDKNRVDFYSNDYLGFARCRALRSEVLEIALAHEEYKLGSTGSRLISGNDDFTEQLEKDIAGFHYAESALLFNSGYDANVGLFSSIVQRGDTIIADELAHASIIDGARLSNAFRYTFKHNDLESLENKLKASKGNTVIAVESVYSMDGDQAPLTEIVQLAEKFGASVIVDEAHAVGIFGAQGRGLVCQLELENRVFARVVTFGKSLGAHGAAVLGSSKLRSFLINYARSFIYSTAAPAIAHLTVKRCYERLQNGNFQPAVHEKIRTFKKSVSSFSHFFLPSDSPIQSLILPGNQRVRQAAEHIRNEGFNVKAILHPTVQQGNERLRICLHLFNHDTEINTLSQLVQTLL